MQFVATFENVEKKFGAKSVLKGLSFNLAPLSFTALVGNNGCGKSTTINILCNLVDFDFGKVSVFDCWVDPNYTSYKAKLGIVLSKPSLIPSFSCIENLSFIGKFHNIEERELIARMNQLVDFLKIQNINLPLEKLSQGNQMKVAIATALIHNPEFLILDEPFANLDIATTNSLIQLFKSFYGKKTLLITSHNLNLVTDLCDSFLVMESGKIVSQLSKSDLGGQAEVAKKIKELTEHRGDISNLRWLK